MHDYVKRYFKYNDKPSFQKIDEYTAYDLDLDELFSFIDYTKSSIGQQYLYNLLRNIPERNIISENEDWISTYEKDEKLKNKVEKLLSKLNHYDAYYICSLFQLEQPKISKKKQIIYRLLQFIPFITLLLFILLNSKIALFILFISFIINLAIHYKNKQVSFIYSGSIPQLLKMFNIAEKLKEFVILKNTNIELDLKEIKKLRKDFRLFRFETKLDNDISSITWLISEIIRIFFFLEPVALYKAFSSINNKKKEVHRIFEYIGLIDTLQSVLQLRSENTCCIPQQIQDCMLSSNNIYHPLIPKCIPNSFILDNRSFLIMGSNMSGKTSFMRTVAINALTAQTLNICFADQFNFQRQKIWTSITIGDYLPGGISYYLAEVLRIKTILEGIKSGSNLIIVDELFKGTNTEERVAISKSVLKYLSNNKNNIILFSTHDTRLPELVDHNKYTIVHFKEIVENNSLIFPYLIQEGKPTTRNAIKILELYDYPQEIIEDSSNTIEVNS